MWLYRVSGTHDTSYSLVTAAPTRRAPPPLTPVPLSESSPPATPAAAALGPSPRQQRCIGRSRKGRGGAEREAVNLGTALLGSERRRTVVGVCLAALRRRLAREVSEFEFARGAAGSVAACQCV